MTQTSIPAVFGLLALLGGVSSAAPPAQAPLADARHRLTLSGSVTDAATGKPVDGATVALYTAGPRVGTSPFCPSCYPDCQKREKSDGSGAFHFSELDPSLRFTVLVVRSGYAPQFFKRVDPKSGVAHFAIKPNPAGTTDDPAHLLRGRVIDATGAPVADAIFSLMGYGRGEGHTFGPAPDGVEPMAVSEADGSFLFHVTAPTESLLLQIEARGFAPRVTGWLPSGKPATVRLGVGATLTGHLVAPNGQPIRNATIEVVQVNRNSETFVGVHTIGTNPDGDFALPNVQPSDAVVVSVHEDGPLASANLAVPVQRCTTAADGATTSLGVLHAVPAAILRGKVTRTDGKPIPTGTRILLGRGDTWDAQQFAMPPDGRFVFRGIPLHEKMGMTLWVPGCHLSTQTPGLNREAYRLDGLGFTATQPGEMKPRNLTLLPGDEPTAAELLPVTQSDATLSERELAGCVTDAATGHVLSGATITLLHADLLMRDRRNGVPTDLPGIPIPARTDAMGRYRLPTPRDRAFAFAVLVARPGYTPLCFDPINPDTDGDFALTALSKTSGKSNNVIRGRVVDNFGKPVVGAALVPACVMQTVGARTSYTMVGPSDLTVPLGISEADGHFTIPVPSSTQQILYYVEARGFATLTTGSLKAGASPVALNLSYGAAVSGRVLDPQGKPLPGLQIELNNTDTIAPARSAFTDAGGRFVFPHVQPRAHFQLFAPQVGLLLDRRLAVSGRKVVAGAEGANSSVGDIRAAEASSLKGQFVLTDGKPVPDMRYMSVQSGTGHGTSRRIDIASDGSFTLDALAPNEPIALSFLISGYCLDPHTVGIDDNGGGEMQNLHFTSPSAGTTRTWTLHLVQQKTSSTPKP